MADPAPPVPRGLPEGAIFCGRIRWHRSELRPSGALVSQVFPDSVATAARGKDQLLTVLSRASGADGLQQYDNVRLGVSGGKWRISGASQIVKAMGLPPDTKHLALWRMPLPDERLFLLHSNEAGAGGGESAAGAASADGEDGTKSLGEQEPADVPLARKGHKRQMRQERNRQLRQRVSADKEAEPEAGTAAGGAASSDQGAAEAAADSQGQAGVAEDVGATTVSNTQLPSAPALRTRGALARGAAVPSSSPRRRGRQGRGGAAAAAAPAPAPAAVDMDAGGGGESAGAEVRPVEGDVPAANGSEQGDHDMQPQPQPPQQGGEGQQEQLEPHQDSHGKEEAQQETPMPVVSPEPSQPQLQTSAHPEAEHRPADPGVGRHEENNDGPHGPVGDHPVPGTAGAGAATSADGTDTECSSRVTVTTHMLQGGYLVLDLAFAVAAGLSATGPAHGASRAVELLERSGTVVQAVLALTVVPADDTGGSSNTADEASDGVAGLGGPLSLAGAVALKRLEEWMSLRGVGIGSVVLVTRSTAGLYCIAVEKHSEGGQDGGRGGSGGDDVHVGGGGGGGGLDCGSGRGIQGGNGASSSQGREEARTGTSEPGAPSSTTGAPSAACHHATQDGGAGGHPTGKQAEASTPGLGGASGSPQPSAAGPMARGAAVADKAGEACVEGARAWDSEAVARIASRENILSVTTSATHLLVAQLMAKWPQASQAGAAAAAYG